MARKFKELEARMSAEAITASNTVYTRLKESMALEELRDALRMTQHELAQPSKWINPRFPSSNTGPICTSALCGGA